jgi:proteasome lid subunit RPN8/RPN11
MSDVLRIRRELVDEIIAHARRDHPDEACGVIAGPEGSDRPERYIPMLNAARSPTFYEFDSADLLKLYREMTANDEVPVVIYHSHTATEAYRGARRNRGITPGSRTSALERKRR